MFFFKPLASLIANWQQQQKRGRGRWRGGNKAPPQTSEVTWKLPNQKRLRSVYSSSGSALAIFDERKAGRSGNLGAAEKVVFTHHLFLGPHLYELSPSLIQTFGERRELPLSLSPPNASPTLFAQKTSGLYESSTQKNATNSTKVTKTKQKALDERVNQVRERTQSTPFPNAGPKSLPVFSTSITLPRRRGVREQGRREGKGTEGRTGAAREAQRKQQRAGERQREPRTL
jgi:hypothetical protein